LLGHAYAYGYDEVKQEQYAAVEQTSAAVKAAMPGVLTMTTACDYTYWPRHGDAVHRCVGADHGAV